MNTDMKFGVFLQPVHHISEHPTLALERDLELVTRLDRLGYDEAWIGEHHSTGWENIAAPEVFIAAAAEHTRHIGLGTGVMQVGLHHPLVALDRMIFLDHVTRGRAMFGVGAGGGVPSDLRVFGLSREEAGRRMDESLDAMFRLLFTEGPVDMKTDWFELKGAVLQMAPYSHPHPPFAVASTDPNKIELMGRIGGHVLTGLVPEKVPEIFEALQRGAREAGLSASRNQIMLSCSMHLAESATEAIEAYREGALVERYEFEVAVNGRPKPPNPDDWYSGFVRDNLIGSPDDAISKIAAMWEQSGGFGGLLFKAREWPDVESSIQSWELFARKVAPHFQGHLNQQKRASSAAASLAHVV